MSDRQDRTPRSITPPSVLGASDLLPHLQAVSRGFGAEDAPSSAPAPVGPLAVGPGIAERPTVPAGGIIARDAARLRAGACGAEDLLDETLARLDRWEPSLRSVTLDLRERARERARGADRELADGHDRGLLHGIPIAVKDLLDLAGTRTSAGSRLTSGHVATTSAPVVTALEAAGAVIVAKVNTHEYAFGALTPPTRNPRDLRCMPGGSSGGSGAIVGAGIVAAAVGTDTAGSIREPAALCGVVGLKPTLGRVPTAGVVPLSWSLDTVGPLAASVADVAHLLAACGAPSLVSDGEPLPTSLRGLRMTLWAPSFHILQSEVRDGLDRGLGLLSDAGVELTGVELVDPDQLVAAALVLLGSEALAFHRPNLPGRRDEYGEDVLAYLDLSAGFSGADVIDAQRVRHRFTAMVDAVLATCDVLLAPAQTVLPPLVDAPDVVMEDGRRAPRDLSLVRTLAPFNLSGHPALSLPVAVDGPTRHTVSLQLVAGHGRDRWLLGVGALLEALVGPIPAAVPPA